MKLREEFDKKVDQWLISNSIEAGSTGISVNILLEDFSRFVNSTIPVTKAMFGRVMTKKFIKKQNRKTLEQEYYINKEL